MKIDDCFQMLTLTCKAHVKVTVRVKTSHDPTLIITMDILPQTIRPKTMLEVQPLAKAVKFIVFKVMHSFCLQCSSHQISFWNKLDDKSLRDRLVCSRTMSNQTKS